MRDSMSHIADVFGAVGLTQRTTTGPMAGSGTGSAADPTAFLVRSGRLYGRCYEMPCRGIDLIKQIGQGSPERGFGWLRT